MSAHYEASDQPHTEQAPILTITDVSKSFGGAAALRSVSFDLRPGEVHAIVGMNGAGKSTLVGVLSGAITPDSGIIEFDGTLTTGLTPQSARGHGIATVPQKRDLVASLSIAENVFLGDLPRSRGIIDWHRAHQEAEAQLSAIGVFVDPRQAAGSLSSAEQTMVEIARELHRGGQVLILDEPTATLGGQAAAEVRALITRLRSAGKSIVFISHHLDEILELSDRITVLRDGRHQLTVAASELNLAELVYAMAGEQIDVERPARATTPGPVALAMEGLTAPGLLEHFDLSVRSGEVVAVLGPAGGGQTSLFPLLSGLRRPAGGRLAVHGSDVPWGNIGRSLASGLRCLTGDRQSQGLIGALSIDENIVAYKDRRERRWLLLWRALSARAAVLRAQFGVVTLQQNPPVGQLSGGNQQKVLLAKWLESNPSVCFFEEPTNGVDVAAKADIHRLIDGLAERGTAVLLATSDFEEALRLADQVAVVHAGRIVALKGIADVTRDELVALTVGDMTHA